LLDDAQKTLDAMNAFKQGIQSGNISDILSGLSSLPEVGPYFGVFGGFLSLLGFDSGANPAEIEILNQLKAIKQMIIEINNKIDDMIAKLSSIENKIDMQTCES